MEWWLILMLHCILLLLCRSKPGVRLYQAVNHLQDACAETHRCGRPWEATGESCSSMLIPCLSPLSCSLSPCVHPSVCLCWYIVFLCVSTSSNCLLVFCIFLRTQSSFLIQYSFSTHCWFLTKIALLIYYLDSSFCASLL